MAHHGGRLTVATHNQGLLWSLTCLAHNWTTLLHQLASAFAQATGAPDELAGHAAVLKARADEEKGDHDALAGAAVRRMLHSRHTADVDLASLADADIDLAVQLLSGEPLTASLDAGRSCFTAVGSIDPHEAISVLTDFIGGLGPTDAAPATSPSQSSVQNPRRGWQQVQAGGGESACVRAAWTVPGRSAPDHPALYAAHLVLGGGYNARLMRKFRQTLRWSYSPWSRLHHYTDHSLLEANVDVPAAHRSAAQRILLEEVEQLRTHQVPLDELTRAVGHACGTLAASLAPQSGLAAMLTHIQSLGLAHTWLWEWPRTLQAVTPDQLHQAAHRWLRPDSAARVTISPVTTSGRI
ncbi:insulinase family protein [Streptomyces mobaraensis NBRC 13819 = DSM 40847]|uniref:M16 family metallopeptidase n=1 Tax=Streptomyces mobaraensis TaxID=35621 RepID=UPI00131A44DE|nr:insulinase family protein [Streptomyces mobaraensis]QTT76383.1 insulinase family protein [Streptomyces mobaraensis NBRC 13819 = DSM 40847]